MPSHMIISPFWYPYTCPQTIHGDTYPCMALLCYSLPSVFDSSPTRLESPRNPARLWLTSLPPLAPQGTLFTCKVSLFPISLLLSLKPNSAQLPLVSILLLPLSTYNLTLLQKVFEETWKNAFRTRKINIRK